MQYFFSKAVFIAAAVMFVSGISPDRVKLKNGKIHDNVKTSLRGNTLSIQHENGKQEMIPASEIAELKPSKVRWKQTASPKTAESEISAKEEKKEIAQAEPETLSEKQSLSSKGSYNYLYSLIPGWSSLNTGRYWYAGIGISLLELGALRKISGRNELRPLLDDEDAVNLHIISALNMKETGTGHPLRDAALIGYYRRHTLDGRDATDSTESFLNRRNGFIALSVITVIDVVLAGALQEKAEQKADSAFSFTFRTAGKENFSLAFTKNF